MRRGRTIVALSVVVAAAACGGAVAFDDPSSGDVAVGSRPPRGPGGRPGFDASRYPYDAAMPTCACETELEQVDGSCDFITGDGLIACVADHTDGGYSPLGTAVACKGDGGTEATSSWTPSTTPNELSLCGCTPGETHAVCVKYY